MEMCLLHKDLKHKLALVSTSMEIDIDIDLLCSGSYYNGDSLPYQQPGAYYDYSATGAGIKAQTVKTP